MKRLNVKLTVWLVAGALFLIIGTHFLHAYQIDRNAVNLLRQAQDEKKEGKITDAVKHYNTYLKYRDEDETAFKERALLLVEIAKSPDATGEDVWNALSTLNATVTRFGEMGQLRRELVDFSMRSQRWKDAMEHIKLLRSKDGTIDPELELKYATCELQLALPDKAVDRLCALVGYDKGTHKFKDKAPGEKLADAYVLLAGVLHGRQKDEAGAEIVINRMVEVNQDSFESWLQRGRYRIFENKRDKAKPDVEQALKLAPDDLGVILAMAEISIMDKDYARAESLIAHGLEKHPKSAGMYVARMQLDVARDKIKDAIAILQKGVTTVSEDDSRNLLLLLSDTQAQAKDTDGLMNTLEMMKQRKMRPEWTGFVEARILVFQENWRDASRQLEIVRPTLIRTNRAAQVEALLGICYENLGQYDMALDAFESAIKADSTYLAAKLGLTRIQGRLNRPEAGAAALASSASGESQAAQYVRLTRLQAEIASQLKRPKASRDWRQVNMLTADLLKDKKLTDLQRQLIQADVYAAEGETKKAMPIVEKLVKEHGDAISVWITAASVVQRENRPIKERAERMSKLLDRATKAAGDQMQLRLIRINTITALGGDDVKQKLEALEKGVDKFKPEEQVSFWTTLGNAYHRLQDYDATKRCWAANDRLQPKDPKHVQMRFDLALEFNKADDLKAAVKEIRELYGDDDPLSMFCQSVFLSWSINNNEVSPQDRPAQLDRARQLLDRVTSKRPSWFAVPRLRGDLALLDDNTDEAIDQYKRSLELAPNSRLARQLAMLLARNNRSDEAASLVAEMAGDDGEVDPLADRLSLQKQMREGNREGAEETARKLVEEDPKFLPNRWAYTRALHNVRKDVEAERVARETVTIDPKSATSWLVLVDQLALSGKGAEAIKAIDEAAEAVSPESKTLFLAQSNERVQNVEKAEKYYLETVEADPKDARNLARVATFYLVLKRDGAKANEYLDKIIALPDQDKDGRNAIHWARRLRAQTLGQGKPYSELQKALKLIDANAAHGQLSDIDLLAKANLLAVRSDMVSKASAIDLLEKVRSRRPLTPQEQLTLSQLYERTNGYDSARSQLISVLGASGSDPNVLGEFVKMLLAHNDLDEAESWLKKLEAAQPDKPKTLELRARLLAKRHENEKAEQLIEQMIPRPLKKNQVGTLVYAAGVLKELGLNTAAEERIREYVELEPREVLGLALFLGEQGNITEALVVCDQARKAQPLLSIVQVALKVLREHPEEAQKQHFDQVAKWIQGAIEEAGTATDTNAVLTQVLLQRSLADLLDLEGKPKESIQIYRTLLDRKDLDATTRAEIQNNLSFLLACNPTNASDPEEAVRLCDESINYFGPVPELIDTRAVARIAQGDYKGAVNDLNMAIKDSPTAYMYFHRAWAESKIANQKMAAAEDLKKVKSLAFEGNRLSPTERAIYSSLNKELGVK